MLTQKMQKEKRERENEHACMWGRERPPNPVAPLFMFFFPAPGPALYKLGLPGVLFVLPEVLTPVVGPSFVLFSRAFPFLVFQPLPFRTPFSYSNYLTNGINGTLYTEEEKTNELEDKAIETTKLKGEEKQKKHICSAISDFSCIAISVQCYK